MAEFPYLPNSANLIKIIKSIPKIGVPSKVTIQWIKGQGYTSSNDQRIPKTLKELGFTDNQGVPTQRWKDYRDEGKAGHVMANALQETYGDLFSNFPDAHRKDDEALTNYFRANTNVGDKALSFMVRTFKQLAPLADFEAQVSADVEVQAVQENSEATTTNSAAESSKLRPVPGKLTINLNVQLQLPATDDASVYDKLFAALKKHILQAEDE